MDKLKIRLPEEMEEVKKDVEDFFIPAAPGNEEDPLARSAMLYMYSI